MSLTDMIATGGTNPVLLFLFALIIGGLHGLEPGHSKTMIAAYIVAIQGSVKQAILLGASAAFSHSIIVWVLAIAALTWGNEMIGPELEPWFMMASGVLVLGIAAWMFLRNRPQRIANHHHPHRHHDHAHNDDHGHHHHNHEHHHHGHGQHLRSDHHHEEMKGMDAHARAHAMEIRERLADGRIGTFQTILFGLSGGLIPCPAAITVFILCLQLGKMTLGITLVTAFSLGLALTLIAVGVIAALGAGLISQRTSMFSRLADAAPWLSAALIAVVGLLIIWGGYAQLGYGHGHVH